MPNNPLLEPSKLNPYYIVAPGYTRFSGGIRVLHLLAHLLTQRGHQAFLSSPELNPLWSAIALTDEIVEAHNIAGKTPIVIYPEVVHGNPMNAGCAVRYLLNYPGKLGGPASFDENDILVWYSNNMRNNAEDNNPVLCVPYLESMRFSPPNTNTQRHGACFYAGKYQSIHKGTLHPVTKDATEILTSISDKAQTQSDLVDLFQRSEVFYTYEATGLALEAVLCGCPAVFIPNEYLSRDQIILADAWGYTGIAWGLDPSDLEKAKNTVGQAAEKFQDWIKSFSIQLDAFIETTQIKSLEPDRKRQLRHQHPYVTLPPIQTSITTISRELSSIKSELVMLRTDCLERDEMICKKDKMICKLESQLEQSDLKKTETENLLKKYKNALGDWNAKGWFTRAFHKLRFK